MENQVNDPMQPHNTPGHHQDMEICHDHHSMVIIVQRILSEVQHPKNGGGWGGGPWSKSSPVESSISAQQTATPGFSPYFSRTPLSGSTGRSTYVITKRHGRSILGKYPLLCR